MNARLLLTIAVLTVVIGTGRGNAQELLLAPVGAETADVGASQYSLYSADATVVSTSPLFLGDPAAPGRVAMAATVSGVAGAMNNGRLTVGFEYLRPFWSFRDFTLAVPPAYAGAFPVLADIGHTDNHFAFVPQVRYDFNATSLGFDVGAAATFLSLAGRFQRNVATTGGVSGNLEVTYDMTLISVIPVQASRRVDAAELFAEKGHDGPAGALVDLSIGTRYIALDQDFDSTLNVAGTAGVNTATQNTTQNFRGIGLTAACGWQVPAGPDWVTFLGARGSILVGENQRTSTATVIATGLPAFTDTITESKTTLVPVVEVEAGIEWGSELGDRLVRGEIPPLMSVRVAAVGQYWGGLGPLSAGSDQGFRTNDLFLAGVSVQIGLRH